MGRRAVALNQPTVQIFKAFGITDFEGFFVDTCLVGGNLRLRQYGDESCDDFSPQF